MGVQDDAGGDAGTPDTIEADTSERIDGGSCTAADAVCPDGPPSFGGACVGDLMCEYPTAGGGPEERFECRAGEWAALEPCLGCSPVLAERCSTPFAGTDTLEFEVGTATGAFSAFSNGIRVQATFGGQGSAMIGFRVKFSDPNAPSCVSLNLSTRMDGVAAPPAQHPVAFRCGETRNVFAILPDNPCDERDYELTLTVEAVGIGTQTYQLILEGGLCTGSFG